MARNMKRRAPTPQQPVHAPEPEPQVPAGAPYDPVSVPVRQLQDSLGGLDADQVLALRSADPRASSHRYYDARLEELADA